VIVEFAGLPGAGKTTLRERLRSEAAAANVPVLAGHLLGASLSGRGRIADRAAARVAGLVTQPRVTAWGAAVLADRGRPWRERLFAFRLLAVTLDNHRWLRRQNPDALVLVDEGFAQRAMLLLSGADGGVNLERAQRYARAVPVPRVVVHVRIDPSESVRRTADRDRGLPARFARLSGDVLLASLADAASLLDVVISELGRRGARIVEVDGSARRGNDPPAELLEAVGLRPAVDGMGRIDSVSDTPSR
jgi:thymidylate kinase